MHGYLPLHPTLLDPTNLAQRSLFAVLHNAALAPVLHRSLHSRPHVCVFPMDGPVICAVW